MHAMRARKLKMAGALVLATGSAAILLGCAIQKYQAAPVYPAKTAASLESRSLASPGLRQFVANESHPESAKWPPAEWNLADLTLAAFYFNPSLEVARKRVSEAEAAIVTAKARPNPTLNADIGGETSPESPWLAGIGFSLPIETAGKRKFRTSEAERLADVARWDLARTAWNVRARVRSALTEYVAARDSMEVLRQEEQLRDEQVKLYQQRFSVGMIPQPELNLARIDDAQAMLAHRTAEGRVSVAQTALAAAIGVPVSAIASSQIAWPEYDEPPSVAALNPGKIQTDAALNRLDIRRALAAYSAADAALRLEIARQYPDVNLGPSYAFEEGSDFFPLNGALTLPILNRNQGPIAEAKARRQQMAAQLLAVQAAGIANSEQALAKYRAALSELSEARQLLQQAKAQQRATQKALTEGQSDRVALNGAQLQTAITSAAELDALFKAQQALGELENAVQRPLVPGDIEPLTPESPMLTPPERKRE